MYVSPAKLKRLFNWYPPYLGAGVKIKQISDDWRYCEVEMKRRWYNRNAVGSHFGGSLYSMVDPQIMLMLMQILGRDYYVWDKHAEIDFIKATKSTVSAHVRISDESISEIYEHTADGDKYLPKFEIDVVDPDGELIAKVQKVIYVRKKPAHR